MPQITTPPMIPVIDFDLISKWRGICHETHGDICNKRYSEVLASHIDFLLLVDVVEWSLVRLPTSIPTPYIALSYVWGRAAMLKTTKANFQKLQQPGALRSINADIIIPATIRDAIYLVEALGERYLWGGCLCVVQDADPDELSTMLRAMAYIYASAELTIVAAGGFDAHCGLKGASDPAQNRALFDVRARIVTMPPVVILRTRNGHLEVVHSRNRLSLVVSWSSRTNCRGYAVAVTGERTFVERQMQTRSFPKTSTLWHYDRILVCQWA